MNQLSQDDIKALEKSLKFFSLAETAATYSKDKSTKVGAVALDMNQNVICLGYNGFPRRVKDIPERHERPLKYSVTCHAEENVVSQAAYTGGSLRESILLVTTLFPCTTCARLMIQAGVRMVITSKLKNDPKWDAEEAVSRGMFEDAGIPIIHYYKDSETWERIV